MSFLKHMESTLFYFGFKRCKEQGYLNFLKLNENDYLLMIIFEKYDMADLIHAKFDIDENPCNSEPYWENPIKLNFSPKSDSQIIRDFLEDYKK